MATSREYLDDVMEKLSRIGMFSSRKMMGEYCVYYKGKMVAEVCDNRILLKPTASVLALLPDAERAYPYEGSKSLMVLVKKIDDVEFFKGLFDAMYAELPEKKPKAHK